MAPGTPVAVAFGDGTIVVIVGLTIVGEAVIVAFAVGLIVGLTTGVVAPGTPVAVGLAGIVGLATGDVAPGTPVATLAILKLRT